MSASLGECAVQGVQLRRGHANVNRTPDVTQQVPAGVLQKRREISAEIVIGDAGTGTRRAIRHIVRAGR